MGILMILKVIAAVGTILVGLYSLIWPKRIKGFTGLAADSPRAMTEIRAVLGGFFVALGLAPLLFGLAEDMFMMLGFTYLIVGAVRAVSMFVDKSVMQSNIISLLIEVAFGVVLAL